MWIATFRFADIVLHAFSIALITLSRRSRSISRMSAVRRTRLGMLLIAPGNTSQMPTVATVSTAPLPRAAFSIAKMSSAPAQCAPSVVEALSNACRKHQQEFLAMVSRAYHDSLFMSRIAPTAMLFIPCRNGYSHRPDEYASPEDIARGTLVLAEALATLSA